MMRAASYAHSARETDIKRAFNVEQIIWLWILLLLLLLLGSETDQSKKRELVIPSPVLLSDADDDAVSPRQFKLAMAKQIAE